MVPYLEILDLNDLEPTPLLTQCAGLTIDSLVSPLDEDLDLRVCSILDEDQVINDKINTENRISLTEDDEIAADGHLLRACASLPMQMPPKKANPFFSGG